MLNSEQIKREYNTIIKKIEQELNSLLLMTAAALGLVAAVSFMSAGTVYNEEVIAHLLGTALLFVLLFAVMFTAKLAVMRYIRVRVRESLIQDMAAEPLERSVSHRIIIREKGSISA